MNRYRARNLPVFRQRTLDLAFNPAEPRDTEGKWTRDETRAWLDRHPVSSKNVVDTWDQATPGEKKAGEVWYDHAHKVAQALSKRYGVSVRTAAGLLATYSPQTAWGQNIRDAAEVLREHHGVGGPGAHIWWHKDPTTPNTFEEREGIMAPGGSKTRADRILAGEDPEEVFAGRNKNGTLKPSSLKIRAFAELIANGTTDPSNPRVVIDRHAAGVARGVRLTEDDYGIDGPSSSAKRFAVYTKAYTDAAKQISAKEGRTITPEMVQAVTWLTRQRLNGSMENQVGKTRKKLGDLDTKRLNDYVSQYLPEAKTYLPQTGYADLSNPAKAERGVQKVVLPPAVDSDSTVRNIARVLASSARFERLEGDFEQEVTGISVLLRPYGIKADAIRLALRLTHKEGGGRRGTAHVPNARLAEHAATLEGKVREYRDAEVYFRAAYLANASQRLQRSLDSGDSEADALRRERVYYKAHEEARRGRLNSAAQVQRAARLFGEETPDGTLVGWYLNPLLRNDAECIAANGHNFYAEQGTVIGLPGSVHNRCGCYAGAPHDGASLVNEVLSNVVALAPRAKPQFKLKEKRRTS